jgi:flagellar protein FlaG
MTMVGNLTSVTAAPTRTSAPSTAETAGGSVMPATIGQSGKDVSGSGEGLPPKAEPAQLADTADTVRQLNALMAERQRDLSFHIDEASGRTVITVRDATTAQVVRQIPAEEVLAVSRALRATGGLLDELA